MSKKRVFIISLTVICIILLFSSTIFIYKRTLKSQQMNLALDTLTQEEYQSVFLSMYDISTFSEEDFTIFRGISTLKSDYGFQSADEINQALEHVFSSGNRITNIYLGLDPLMLWHSQDKDIANVQETFEKGWFSYADAHPETTFEILLSFPSMDYWLSLEEADLQASLTLYQQLTGILTARSNITVYYPGGQEWLINNPANYISDFAANDSVAQKIFLQTFCDHAFQITGINAQEMVQQLAHQITARKSAPVEYPDFSQWDIVFMGDSVFGNYEGSMSIPGVVNGLSEATVYNCAEGGTSAAQPEPGALCFPQMAQDFVSQKVSDPASNFGRGMQQFIASHHAEKKLCFIINYGLNDYFGGYAPENPEDAFDITTYAGAMRTGIATLQEKYPDALYLIIGPGRVTYFNDGADPQSEAGKPLADYYRLSASLAGELNIPYIDLYTGFPDSADLSDVLADGCHYNEYGRYLLGIKIISFMAELLP